MTVPTGSSFDANFYLFSNGDVKTAAETAAKDGKTSNITDFAYDHWLNYGAREARNPNAFFNTANYLSNNKDVQQAFNNPGKDSLNPLTHYDLYGWAEKDSTDATGSYKRSAGVSTAFDAAYYAAANPAYTNYGSPLVYFMTVLRAAATATPGASLSFAASAYVPSVAYGNFDYVYYLQKNSDVARSILGDTATVPAANSSLELIQRAKILYHWFNYGQMETRIAHKIDSSSADTVSDFARITDPTTTLEGKDKNQGGNQGSAAPSATIKNIFSYITENTTGTSAATPTVTITGPASTDSALIWKSNELLTKVTVTGIATLVFAGSAGKAAPTDVAVAYGTSAVDAKTLTISRGTDLSFADATVTKLAVIHTDNYKLNASTSVTGGNNFGMAFYNIKETTSNILIQGLTSGTAAVKQYDLFGYKAAPTDKTVILSLNNVKGADIDSTVINIASKSATDIKTIKLNVQSTSAVTLTAADGDGYVSDIGNLLVEQRVTKLVITGGDKGVTFALKDGVGTSTFDTLDTSAFKGDKITYHRNRWQPSGHGDRRHLGIDL